MNRTRQQRRACWRQRIAIAGAVLLLSVPLRGLAQSVTPLIGVTATLNGQTWSGSVAFQISGPSNFSGSSVPQTYTNPPLGTYTLTYIAGGPSGASLNSISPSATQTLGTASTIVFTLVFITNPPAIDTVIVNATLDGTIWSGPLSFQIQGANNISGASVPQTYANQPLGSYTLRYVSGGPAGASLSEISPAVTQTLVYRGSITFTLVFVSGPPPPGSLSAIPRKLHLTTAIGSGVLRRSMQVTTGSAAGVNWTATATLANGSNWLSISPAAGTATSTQPSALVAELNPTGLAEGLYQATIVVRNTATGTEVMVPVALAVRAVGSRLQLDRTAFFFATVPGGMPQGKTLRIFNAGSGNLQWSIPSGALTAAPWLQLSATAGNAAAGTLGSQITLNVSTAGRSSGVYQALLPVVASGGGGDYQLVTITMYIAPITTPPFGDLDAYGRIFLAQEGGAAPSPQTVVVQNIGSGLAEFQWLVSTSSGGSWLSVSPVNGSPSSTTPATAQVSVNPAFLTPGIYRGNLLAIFSTGASQGLEILLVVAPAGTFLQRELPGAAACGALSLDLVGTTIGNGLSLPVSFPRPLLAQVVDNCGAPVDDATVVATIDQLSIEMGSVGGGQYSGTWTPTAESAAVAVALAATHPTLGTAQRNYTVSTSAAAGGVALPVAAPNGVVEGAGFTPQRPLAPGSIVSIFGTGFASGNNNALSVPLERSLGGTSVRIGSEDAPLYFVGPGQINAQVPFTAAAGESVSIVVNANGRLTAPQTYLIAAAQPGIFNGAVLDFQNNPASGGLPVTAANPARIGHDLIIYSGGLGLVETPVGTGEASPAARALLPVTVTIGGVEVPVAYAGLTPGYVGLYQVNVNLTGNVPTGDNLPVVLQQNGIESNPVLPILISIRP